MSILGCWPKVSTISSNYPSGQRQPPLQDLLVYDNHFPWWSLLWQCSSSRGGSRRLHSYAKRYPQDFKIGLDVCIIIFLTSLVYCIFKFSNIQFIQVSVIRRKCNVILKQPPTRGSPQTSCYESNCNMFSKFCNIKYRFVSNQSNSVKGRNPSFETSFFFI